MYHGTVGQPSQEPQAKRRQGVQRARVSHAAMSSSKSKSGPAMHRPMLATNLSLVVPPGVGTHQLLAYRSQNRPDAPIQFITVPEGTVAYALSSLEPSRGFSLPNDRAR
jgi:hypothetical protein